MHAKMNQWRRVSYREYVRIDSKFQIPSTELLLVEIEEAVP
jgi:hypothetical protein